MAERVWVVDNDPSQRYPIYTRGNVGEVFPDAVAPLSWTMFGIPGAEPGWRDAFAELGAFDVSEFAPGKLEILGVFGGYCYLNVSITRIFGVRFPGLSPEIMDYTLWGEMEGVPPYVPSAGDESPEHTARLEKTLGKVLTTTDLPELLEDLERVEELRRKRPLFTTLSNEEILAGIRKTIPFFRELFKRHLVVSYSSSVPLGIISSVCAEGLGDPTLAMRLVAGIGGVASAAPSFAMWDLGRLAASDPAISREFDEGISGLLERLSAVPDAASFRAGFASFVEEFGSRGPNEWEARSPTWETRPEMALAAIDRMRLANPKGSPTARHDERVADREGLTREVLSKLEGDPEVHGQMQAALASAQVFLAGRERTKTTVIKFVHEIRIRAMEIGQRMVDAGVFVQKENIGMLRDDELDDFLANPMKWRDTVLERETLYSKLQSLDPPFIVVGEVPPIETWQPRSTVPAPVAPGTTLPGIPGCPGEATGRARVILDPADPRALEPGDVLVAPITDPAWTPLFVPAAAVVVDVGAQLSHAVIVSRELGIPCVVSVTNGTRKIPDGAQVKVDGTRGTVTVLSAG